MKEKMIVVAAVLLAAASSTVVSAQSCGAMITYTTPGGLHDCTVPVGVDQLTITATGADGGERGSARFGGSGGSVSATFSVAPGDHIRVIVWEAGEDEFHAAGGGGGTAVINCGNPQDCAGGTLLVVAGGGGGAGRQNGRGGSSSAGSGNGGNAIEGGSGGGLNSGGTGCGSCDGGAAVLGGQASNTSISQPGTNAGSTIGDGGEGYGGGGAGSYNTGGGVQRLNGGGGGGYSGGNGGADDGVNGPNSGGSGGSNYIRSGATAITNSSGVDGGSGGDNTNGSVTLDFSQVLPVELVQFTALFQKGQVELRWETATELNNAGFDIQRSADGRDWQSLAFVPGAGTAQETQSYTYIDERPLPVLNYYRLKQIDFDGQFEYSKIVSVDAGGEDNGIRLYPNPASDATTLAFETAYAGEAVLNLYNPVGQIVKTQPLSLEPGAFRAGIELDGLPAGVYLVEVRYGKQRMQKRFVLQK